MPLRGTEADSFLPLFVCLHPGDNKYAFLTREAIVDFAEYKQQHANTNYASKVWHFSLEYFRCGHVAVHCHAFYVPSSKHFLLQSCPPYTPFSFTSKNECRIPFSLLSAVLAPGS